MTELLPPGLPLRVLLTAIALCGLSGLPGLLLARDSPAGQRVAAGMSLLGSALGLLVAGGVLLAGPVAGEAFHWALAPGPIGLEVDALSAAFLVPVFLVSAAGNIYGLSYWRQQEHPGNGRKLRWSFGVLTAALALVMIARHGFFFLVAWEVMALAAFFAATTEDDRASVRAAGWVYLVATHTGTLCLFAMVVLLADHCGGWSWNALACTGSSRWVDNAAFLLALAGFGFKAGLFPMHFWLPAAHANAPSHVSAMMSGVMLKAGIYGILRVTSMFAVVPSWWGTLLLVLGATSGLYGINAALAQRDIKRLLAYSSIENVGIITMGVGLALTGRALDRPAWVFLGLGAAVLHAWNHGLFKSLLFLGSGAVIHATGTRDMERLGGLAARMPRTALAFVVGALAVSGLPPLNGFMSEYVLYVGLLTAWSDGPPALWFLAFVSVALAVIGAVAVAALVKLVGLVFLGAPRTPDAEHAHDPPPSMLLPLGALAVLCLLAGLSTPALAPVLHDVTVAWLGRTPVQPLYGAAWATTWVVAAVSLGLVLATLVLWPVYRRMLAAAPVRTGLTWDCGYAAPTARMQYTGRSFGEWVVEHLVPAFMRPRLRTLTPHGLFPNAASFSSETPDMMLEDVYTPLFSAAADRLARLRLLQQGRLPAYLLYIVVTLVVMLAWTWWR